MFNIRLRLRKNIEKCETVFLENDTDSKDDFRNATKFQKIRLIVFKTMLPPGVKWAMWLGMWVLRCIMIPFIRIRALCPARKLPPIDSKLLLQSATSLAHLIRTKQVTSEEVVRAYIQRILIVNPLLNAVVDERFEEALKDSHAVDEMLKTCIKTADQLAEEKPFLGVPFTVKESIAVEGLSNACGQRRKMGECAGEDAESVRLLRGAGAIPLVVSNCPELCMSYETFNKVTGTTNNPYDLRRSPGGSSGGEAALLGAGASVIGLGSDIGGSSRIPAMFTGVFGHKPTPGLVSYSGHIPTATDKNWYRFFTVAPMTRYATDLAPIMKILSHENVDKLRLNEEIHIKDIKVYYMEDDGGAITSNKVNPEICQAMRKALVHLQSTYNIQPKKVHIKDLKYALELSCSTLLALEGVTSIFQKEDDPKDWRSVTLELLKYFVCLSDSNLPPILYGIGKKLADRIPEERKQKIAQRINNLQKQFKTMLGDDGIFLYPTFIDPAGYHLEMYFKCLSCMYSVIFNTLELPATNCPMGLTRGGLPISIQIVAAPCQDRLSILMAQELEKTFGGWVPPPAADTNLMV